MALCQVIISALHCCPLLRKDWEVAADEGIYCDLCERLCRAYGEWCDRNIYVLAQLNSRVGGNAGFHGTVPSATQTSVTAASKKLGTAGLAKAANHESRMLETRLI